MTYSYCEVLMVYRAQADYNDEEDGHMVLAIAVRYLTIKVTYCNFDS